MKLLACPLSMTASSCDESTLMGVATSAGRELRSKARVSTASVVGGKVSRRCIRLSMMGLCCSFSAFVWMSFHITNLLKENSPRTLSSRTSHRPCCAMDLRMASKMSGTSTPLSSLGRGSKVGTRSRNCWRRNSMRVTLRIGSSSRNRMIYPLPFRTILTGRSSMGAKRG